MMTIIMMSMIIMMMTLMVMMVMMMTMTISWQVECLISGPSVDGIKRLLPPDSKLLLFMMLMIVMMMTVMMIVVMIIVIIENVIMTMMAKNLCNYHDEDIYEKNVLFTAERFWGDPWNIFFTVEVS